MNQWHPVFALLLRPTVEAYYEVRTTMPVGDAPREADFVLLCRTTSDAPPFRGLWRHLTTWNILVARTLRRLAGEFASHGLEGD